MPTTRSTRKRQHPGGTDLRPERPASALPSPESRVPSPALALPGPGSRVPGPALAIHLGYGLARIGLPAATSFRRWVAAALTGAGHRKPVELAIRIVDAAEGRELNRHYRGKDYATNVLSFPAELPPGIELPLLGDLAICAPVVLREAAEQGKTPRDHFAHLTIHGVLHLLGYDHQGESDAEHMEILEIQSLATLGMADPYYHV